MKKYRVTVKEITEYEAEAPNQREAIEEAMDYHRNGGSDVVRRVGIGGIAIEARELPSESKD